MEEAYVACGILAAAGLVLLHKLHVRLRLSRAKHPSLRGHARWSRRVARQVAYYAFNAEHFFCSDGAPEEISLSRKEGINRLKSRVRTRSPKSLAYYHSLKSSISDVNFTTAYRVPFPYRAELCNELKLGSIVEESKGILVKDLDDNWRYDISGSYGVNVFGYDFYKECIEKAQREAGPLGPVLGSYHPLIRDNVERLKAISGLDEVSFHMSGTEAVMQAVRLARYHTGKTHLVRLCGAYHGWWDGVQPGIGNQRKTNDVYTLSDLSEKTLAVLATRNDIACLLINPLQALHPNADASGDASLVNSKRSAYFDRERYTLWLEELRAVCFEKNIVLIFDEVFTGFRLAYRGAQEYFGIQADIVTYGKTLGGGFPVGVVCGRHELMKRFRDNQPANISFARGTFNSHPHIVAAMNAFLKKVDQPEYQNIYAQAEKLWDERAAYLNERLKKAELPVEIANLQSIWTILYKKPSRYNWMFQFYLRDQGLELSWVGSGRLIFSLNFSDADFSDVSDRIVQAAIHMQADGWWWQSPTLTDKSIQRQLMKELLQARFPLLKNLTKSPELSSSNDRLESIQ